MHLLSLTKLKLHSLCTHWQAPQNYTQAKACQRVQLVPSFSTTLKGIIILILSVSSLNIHASDFFITTSPLNIRSGAGINYRPLTVLEKGDTVKLLEDVSADWAKVQYHDKIGYVAKAYLQPIEILTIENPVVNEEGHQYIIVLVILALAIAVYSLGKKVFENGSERKSNKNGNPQNVEILNTSHNKPIHGDVDKSIIDINGEKLDLTILRNSIHNGEQLEPPYWSHTYVYSYNEIWKATTAQKRFYLYLKSKVLNGETLDIQGNTNYAFILYFDLLNEYQSHKDIRLLEVQFNLVGQICPKTKRYTFGLLKDELRKRTDSYSIEKLKEFEEPSYQFDYGYTDYNPDYFKLGSLYKDKLGLNKQEISWLNKFYNPSNVFLSIEGCCIATTKQYVTLLRELDKSLKKTETSLVKEITHLKERLKPIYANRYAEWGYYNTAYFGNQAESDIFLVLFKRVENSVRDSYGHKRKVSGDFPYAVKNLSEEFEIRIGNVFDSLIETLKSNIEKPDLHTQIALNVQNVARWHSEFDALKRSFCPEMKSSFIEGINRLEETNQNNPNIEIIFFEASKFIAPYDKVLCLSYYAKYIFYDLKSKSFDNKELNKTVHKSLFKTQEQLDDFKSIITELIKTADIQTAIENISKIYIPKRKKIHLDKSEINEVEQKHEGTVELLNEYLNSENEGTLQIVNMSDEDTEVTIIPAKESDSMFFSDFSIGRAQEELIKRIASSAFKINQEEVSIFATENQLFKNQLIDSINESFSKCLDGEALIEEDGDNYIMEESFYKIISK